MYLHVADLLTSKSFRTTPFWRKQTIVCRSLYRSPVTERTNGVNMYFLTKLLWRYVIWLANGERVFGDKIIFWLYRKYFVFSFQLFLIINPITIHLSSRFKLPHKCPHLDLNIYYPLIILINWETEYVILYRELINLISESYFWLRASMLRKYPFFWQKSSVNDLAIITW